MTKLSKLKNLITNADTFGEGTFEDDVEQPVEKAKRGRPPKKVEEIKEKPEKADYTFDDIKEALDNFINANNRQYFFALKFPEMYRISEQMGRQRAADFYTSGVKYYSDKIKKQVQVFYKNTKYINYFKGNVKLVKK